MRTPEEVAEFIDETQICFLSLAVRERDAEIAEVLEKLQLSALENLENPSIDGIDEGMEFIAQIGEIVEELKKGQEKKSEVRK